jgi:hypothetical protein
MDNLNRYRQQIIESLKLLAIPYRDQCTLFPDFADKPFEVIDTYENAFLLLPPLIEIDAFPNYTIAGLVRIHNAINLALRSPELRDLDPMQFEHAPGWNEIRNMAKEVLTQLHIPLSFPDANYI